MTEMNAVEATPSTWHHTRMRVPLYEVDLGQAVYHGNYYHLFELAREEFLRDLGYPYRRFMEQELHLTIVEVNCRYRRPLHYDETIEIRTGVRWWRRRSLSLAQNIYLAEDHDADSILCTETAFNMVCVRFSGQAKVIPEEFIQCLGKWTGKGP